MLAICWGLKKAEGRRRADIKGILGGILNNRFVSRPVLAISMAVLYISIE